MREITRLKSGRPPKFTEPRRHVTITLPERTLATLAKIDSDRARAIVKVTDAAITEDDGPHVEVVEVAPGLGIIIVGPCRVLQQIKGLQLVEVAPARFLLTVPSGTPIDSIEVGVTDLLDDAMLEEAERRVLSRLRDLIRRIRRQNVVSKAEMLFVDTRAMVDGRTGERNGRKLAKGIGV